MKEVGSNMFGVDVSRVGNYEASLTAYCKNMPTLHKHYCRLWRSDVWRVTHGVTTQEQSSAHLDQGIAKDMCECISKCVGNDAYKQEETYERAVRGEIVLPAQDMSTEIVNNNLKVISKQRAKGNAPIACTKAKEGEHVKVHVTTLI